MELWQVVRRDGVPEQVLTDNGKVFRNLQLAQSALDEWVAYYNTERTHQSLGDVVRLTSVGSAKSGPVRLCLSRPR